MRGSNFPYFSKPEKPENPTIITRTRQKPEGINPNPTRTREAVPEPDFCYPNPSLPVAYLQHLRSEANKVGFEDPVAYLQHLRQENEASQNRIEILAKKLEEIKILNNVI